MEKFQNIFKEKEILQFFGEEITNPEIKELSEGNINYIFLINFKEKSCIVKFAGK